VSYSETVILAFASVRKPAEPSFGAEGLERVASSRQYFVGVCLMSHIEDQFVLRGIEYIMETDYYLYGPEA